MGACKWLEWAASHGDKVFAPCRSRRRAPSSQNIAFHEVGRQAVMADRTGGMGVIEEGVSPRKGCRRTNGRAYHLSVARRCTRNSAQAAGRDALTFASTPISRSRAICASGIDLRRPVRRQLYLYITRAIDYFDIALTMAHARNAFKG